MTWVVSDDVRSPRRPSRGLLRDADAAAIYLTKTKPKAIYQTRQTGYHLVTTFDDSPRTTAGIGDAARSAKPFTTRHL
ncbi:MAG: hypothetical protein JWM76_748 [Pseudonocardiales bacterium]|nr:hypothetical protein [Pseudonocardiales bacterium]